MGMPSSNWITYPPISKTKLPIYIQARCNFEVFFCKIVNWCVFSILYTPPFEAQPAVVKLFFKSSITKTGTPHRQEYKSTSSIIFPEARNCVSVGQINLHRPRVIHQHTQWWRSSTLERGSNVASRVVTPYRTSTTQIMPLLSVPMGWVWSSSSLLWKTGNPKSNHGMVGQ